MPTQRNELIAELTDANRKLAEAIERIKAAADHSADGTDGVGGSSHRKTPRFRKLRIVCITAASLLTAGFLYYAFGNSNTFELSDYDEMMLPVTLGGETHMCVIDSGAQFVTLHTSLLSTLIKNAGLRYPFREVDGKSLRYEICEPIACRLGNVELLSEPHTMFMDLTEAQEWTGCEVEGLIGFPLFEHHIIQIDFDARQFAILPEWTEPKPHWGTAFRIVKGDYRAYLEIKIGEDEMLTFLIDTGSGGSLSLTPDLFSRLVRTGAITDVDDTARGSLAGLHETRDGRLTKARIGEFTLRDLLVDERTAECLVGQDFFRSFLVTFDFAHNRIFLAKGEQYDERSERGSAGMWVRRHAGRNVVRWILRGGPAAMAGFRVDDEIISIAGESVTDMSLREVNWKLYTACKPLKRFQVGVQRSIGEKQLWLTPRKYDEAGEMVTTLDDSFPVASEVLKKAEDYWDRMNAFLLAVQDFEISERGDSYEDATMALLEATPVFELPKQEVKVEVDLDKLIVPRNDMSTPVFDWPQKHEEWNNAK